MTPEERLLETIEGEEELEVEPEGRRERRHQRLERKNRSAIDSFLGSGKRTNRAGIVPRYYGELLTWALRRYLEEGGWEVAGTLGYHDRQPVYIDVNTGCDRRENLLRDGQLLVQKGKTRLVVTVDINLSWRNSVLVEGRAREEKQIDAFVSGVLDYARQHNFYRGQKIEFAGRLRFLDLNGRSWDSLVLDGEIKNEIRSNTTGFLARTELWESYGIPPKRGILLAGEPGTGKTLACKALMAEADGITCIATTAYGLAADEYVTELYELAADLAPCLVFIEDIDLIGQNREESGYQRGPALMALLAVLDGIEEKKEIVTVATTNCLDTLDKALSERPSRFDRVIRLSRPSLAERRELVRRLCGKIPLDEAAQDYIARRSEGCTPAQVQDIVFSLAIESGAETPEAAGLRSGKDDVDRVISRINGRSRQLGFGMSGNHNSDRAACRSRLAG